MAGFFNNDGKSKMSSKLSKISSSYDGLLINNSQSIGYIEGELKRRTGMGMGDDFLDYSMALTDTTSRYRTKTLAFFQLDYKTKREKLREIASNSEIEFVLDTITDDAIVYDQNNKFCYPADIRKALRTNTGVRSIRDQEINEDALMETYINTFEDVYSAWGFDNGVSAWQYFYQYLIDGHLAFEIIYDDLKNSKRVIGFKEIDAATLYPVVKKDERGNVYLEWLQRDNFNNGYRTLSDNQIVYIQYSSHHRTKRISFVERMVRSFNVLRLVESSKVIWHMMYATIRLNTKVPIGTKTIDRAKEEAREYLNVYKEDIHFNQDTGELTVDGQPKLQYYKNYVTPVNVKGEKIEIEAVNFEGPDLQDSQLLNYFYKKLKVDSKLPFSRWDYSEGGGSYLLGPDSVAREEFAYAKFIGRLRTGFAELMTKPIYLQMCLNDEVLKENAKVRNMIGVQFNEDKYFERMKQAEINQKGADAVAKIYGLEEKPDSKSQFELPFLIKKFMNFNEEDLSENAIMKEQRLAREREQANNPPAGAQGDVPAQAGAQATPGSQPMPQSGVQTQPEAGAQAVPQAGSAQPLV